MNICVVNGSPRGENSLTLQTSLYLEKRYPEHTFTVLPAAAAIHRLERDFSEAVTALEAADLILFSYPVYTFLVPSQLTRFVELLKESDADLRGKYVSQISTSKHFYDVTAHRFLEDNFRDLGLKVLPGLSADMEDLPLPRGQKQAEDFFEHNLWLMEKNHKVPDLSGKKPVIIAADLSLDDGSLKKKIRDFRKAFPGESHVVNIGKHKIRGGCLGCLNCVSDGNCIYKDDYQSLLARIHSGSAIVYAFTVKDHSMGSLMKTFDDRQFCNGHRTVTMGSPVAYLVNGDVSKEPNLQLVLEARAEAGSNYLAGIADDSGRITTKFLAENLAYALAHDFQKPQNFYGIGGMKIFRDLIYKMQGMMKADHKFYKAHGIYDFPQNEKGTIAAMYLVGLMFSNPKIKKALGDKINEGMAAPYKKVIDAASPK